MLECVQVLDASTRVNTRENVELTFQHKIQDMFQGLIDSNFELYKRFTDDPTFGKALRDALLDQYLVRHREVHELLKKGESATFKVRFYISPGAFPEGAEAAMNSRYAAYVAAVQ